MSILKKHTFPCPRTQADALYPRRPSGPNAGVPCVPAPLPRHIDFTLDGPYSRRFPESF